MRDGSIGEQELALLRHVADAGGATVGEAAESFGVPRRLARSTVLTMMERLRRKGHLLRRRTGGVYNYRARASSAALLRNAVERFVERHLGGSVSPFLAFLSETDELTEGELGELEQTLAKLTARRRGQS